MDAVRIHMWEFIKSSFNRQVRKDRQRVKTKVAVQSVNMHMGHRKGPCKQAGNRSKHKHQSDQATKAKGIIQAIGTQVNKQNNTQNRQAE